MIVQFIPFPLSTITGVVKKKKGGGEFYVFAPRTLALKHDTKISSGQKRTCVTLFCSVAPLTRNVNSRPPSYESFSIEFPFICVAPSFRGAELTARWCNTRLSCWSEWNKALVSVTWNYFFATCISRWVHCLQEGSHRWEWRRSLHLGLLPTGK